MDATGSLKGFTVLAMFAQCVTERAASVCLKADMLSTCQAPQGSITENPGCSF